jgi:hypothetical protein
MYINLLAVLVAAIASMVIGWAWYTPAVFGNAWMRAVGKKNMGEGSTWFSMLGMFAAALVMSYVLAHFVGYLGAATWWEGAQVAFWLWLGFVAATSIGLVLFEKRSMKLFWINTLHYLVSLVVMAVILACWQ